MGKRESPNGWRNRAAAVDAPFENAMSAAPRSCRCYGAIRGWLHLSGSSDREHQKSYPATNAPMANKKITANTTAMDASEAFDRFAP